VYGLLSAADLLLPNRAGVDGKEKVYGSIP
jgi:hypothetical protein